MRSAAFCFALMMLGAVCLLDGAEAGIMVQAGGPKRPPSRAPTGEPAGAPTGPPTGPLTGAPTGENPAMVFVPGQNGELVSAPPPSQAFDPQMVPASGMAKASGATPDAGIVLASQNQGQVPAGAPEATKQPKKNKPKTEEKKKKKKKKKKPKKTDETGEKKKKKKKEKKEKPSSSSSTSGGMLDSISKKLGFGQSDTDKPKKPKKIKSASAPASDKANTAGVQPSNPPVTPGLTAKAASSGGAKNEPQPAPASDDKSKKSAASLGRQAGQGVTTLALAGAVVVWSLQW